mmetsp:Transcript_136086/g.322553  ORF Transcript_136086/g.322553 Transcript_136086/m.322553 type:complete len:239 (+) Transcript_136086:1990-2706(+)
MTATSIKFATKKKRAVSGPSNPVVSRSVLIHTSRASTKDASERTGMPPSNLKAPGRAIGSNLLPAATVSRSQRKNCMVRTSEQCGMQVKLLMVSSCATSQTLQMQCRDTRQVSRSRMTSCSTLKRSRSKTSSHRSVPKLSEATLRTQSMSGASGKTSKDKPKLVERYVSHKRLQAAHRVTLAFGKLSTLMLPTGRCPARLERLPTDLLRHLMLGTRFFVIKLPTAANGCGNLTKFCRY